MIRPVGTGFPPARSLGTRLSSRTMLRRTKAGRTRPCARLIRVARRDVACDLRAFIEIALDRKIGGRRAGTVGLLEAPIAAVETCDQPLAPFPARRFGLDQRLHLVAPG